MTNTILSTIGAFLSSFLLPEAYYLPFLIFLIIGDDYMGYKLAKKNNLELWTFSQRFTRMFEKLAEWCIIIIAIKGMMMYFVVEDIDVVTAMKFVLGSVCFVEFISIIEKGGELRGVDLQAIIPFKLPKFTTRNYPDNKEA